MMDLGQISLLFPGQNAQGIITGVTIDSRQIQPGELFVALRGERFDGHQFIKQAAEKGAAAILCEEANPDVTIPQFIVPDSLKALAKLATFHRQTIHCPIIAITGSNGKTSVKEMIAAILPPPSFATPGNFNNHIGAPLSVLQLTDKHRFAVLELGASHIGEIAYTVAIVQPQIALINNIAPAHIEGFGSIDGVARAKGEIYAGLAGNGTAIVNDDDNYAHFWDETLTGKKVIRYSLAKNTDVQATDIGYNEQGCAQFSLVLPAGIEKVCLQVPGEHSIRNALAAASCCFAAGIATTDIAAGLERFNGVKGRMTYLKGKKGALIIDDSYNANLRSTLTALEVLSKCPGKRILVLGDMGELGQWTEEHHREVGLTALKLGIDAIRTCGIHSEQATLAFAKDAQHYGEQKALVMDLMNQLDDKTTLLVKGSRSAAMENIVKELIC